VNYYHLGRALFAERSVDPEEREKVTELLRVIETLARQPRRERPSNEDEPDRSRKSDHRSEES
jgi:hypothetical protein